ncbi:MAG: tetratricopeptide repeat protein [Acidobacteriia bacterium]|nr:tetratricopeptide repeat protein [Terriglobia bacterium]
MLGVVLLWAFFLQAGQMSASLMEAQALLDQGKLNQAEHAVRRYLETQRDSADAHYLLGYILFKEQNPKASLEQYTEGARYREPSALDLEVIGCDYFLMEDYGAADQWLTKAVQRNPGDAAAQYFLGRAKYNEKRFDEAVHAFTECLKLDPTNVKAADNLGLSYEGLGKTEDALAAYRKAIASDTTVPRTYPGAYLNLGTLLVDNSHPSEAEPYLVQAATSAPGESRAHQQLGKALLQLNRLEEAQAQLEKAAELTPQSAPVHLLLVQVYRGRGLADKAQLESDRYAALTGAHSSPETPLAEARALLEMGKLAEAEQVTRRYLEVRKNSADAHYLLGYILFKNQDPKSSLAEYTEGAKYREPSAAELEVVASDYVLLKDYPDADKWFTKAVEWNPKDALGWYHLGRTKYNENRFEEAIAAFQQCLKLNSKDVKAEDNLGLSYEGLNRTEEAITAYRTAIAWQTDSPLKDPGPFLNLGSLLVDADRVEEGLPYLLAVVRLDPGDYRTHRQLGKAYMRLNQLEKARTELERAAELAPQNAPVHFLLAQVYRKLGWMDKAKTENDRYVALTGTSSSK